MKTSISHSSSCTANIFSFLLMAAMLATVSSCKQPADFSREIHGLDSLHKFVTAEYEDLNNYEHLQIDSITAHVKYVQNNFVGQMKEQMAILLADYSMIREASSNLLVMRDTLLKQGDVLTSRCDKLKQALSEKATYDAEHNELSEEYAGTAFTNEKKLAADWMMKTKNWKNSMNDLQQQFDKQLPVIQQWVDSIPQRKK